MKIVLPKRNHLLRQVVLGVFSALVVFCFALPKAHTATNLALGKPYTVSPKPNYSLSAPSSDITALTDGKFTAGHFWTQKTTVGWMGAETVEIMIDLEKISVIDSIIFSTSRGNGGGVDYPSHILAFLGTDKNHFSFIGDIAKDPANVAGPYKTKRFILKDIGIKGRFVLLDVLPKGRFLFCDEIDVLEGNQYKGTTGILTIETARDTSERLRNLENKKELLNHLSEKIKPEITARPSSADRYEKIKQRISGFSADDDIGLIEKDIFKLRYEELSNKFPGRPLLIETINPWAQLSPITPPTGKPLQNIFLAMPQDGYDHAALFITNLSPETRQISSSLVGQKAVAPDIVLHQVPFVKSASVAYVADPLVPVNSNFTLLPGESRMVFITAHGKTPGAWQCSLVITNGGVVTSIPIKSEVMKVRLPNDFTLNSVNWGYLDFNLTRDCKTEAVNDLFNHHTNVTVVPPTYLPISDLEKTPEFNRLEAYLRLHRGASKVLLFMNYRNSNLRTTGGKFQYLSEQWKKGFRKWYQEAVQAAAKAGFTQEQVYLYPFDEMTGKEVDQFIALSKWAKQEIPSIKFYATLGGGKSLDALPYLDVAQIRERNNIPLRAKGGMTELWLYECLGPGKSLSPYSYYRMMSWTAFNLGFKGVGFWAYADAGAGDNPDYWDDLKNRNTNYAVIYPGNGNTINSSRRWEAWRMGIEDYELLTMYSKAKGDAVAKALAKSVLDNPLDTSKADEVRRKILMEQSK